MESENIYLRAVEPQDIDYILNLENDPDNWRLSETLFPYSRYDIENFVLNTEHDILINKQLRLMIISKYNDEPLGCIDLFEYNSLHRRAGVGIVISKAHRRKGIAREALTLMANHAFLVLGLHQLFCNIQSDNKSSISLFTQLGYQQTGVRKDWELYDREYKDVYFYQLIKS